VTAPRRVLVADDDPEIVEVLSEFLTGAGFAVVTAANGLEALMQIKRHHPAGVVLDLEMPRLGGLDAIKHIRSFDASIAIVIVSGLLDAELSRRVLGLGAAAALPKPPSFAELAAALGASPAPAPAAQASAAPADTRVVVGLPRRGTVLVVDDEPDIRELLGEYIEGRGYAVRMAADGRAGVREATAGDVDVILLDIDMPDVSGVDALTAIRAVVPAAKVIIVSGTSDAAVVKRTLALGAFDYVTKPIDFDYLSQSLEAAIAMKALESS
jgi:DNA-binding response OmpR family regulator